MNRFLINAAGLALALALVLAREAEASCAFTSGTLVTNGRERISIVLADPPTTRLRLSFDSAAGRHAELEWDPAVDGRLGQQLTLDIDKWQVTASIEPTTLQQGATLVVLNAKFSALTPGTGGTGTLAATYSAFMTNQGAPVGPAAPGAVVVAPQKTQLDDWPHPTLTLHCGVAKPAIDAVRFAGTLSAAGSQRGFGSPVPAPLAEVLSLLGEIAIERAKSGAMSLLKDRLVLPLCTKDGGIRLSVLDAASPSLLLPRTCELLDQLSLDDILSSGKPALRALRDDLRFTIAPAVIRRVGGGSPWTKIVEEVLAVVNRAIDQSTFSPLDAQSVLSLFGDMRGLLAVAPLTGLDNAIKGQLAPLLTSALDEPRFRQLAACADTTTITDEKGCVTALMQAMTLADLQAYASWISPEKRTEFMKEVGGWTSGALPGPARAMLEEALKPKSFKNVPGCSTLATASACALALLGGVRSVSDVYELARHILANRGTFEGHITAWLDTVITANETLSHVVGGACHARLALAIVKTCSGASCGADQIEDMLLHPEDHFTADQELPAAMCWKNGGYRPLTSASLAQFRDLVAQGLSLLGTVNAEKARDRAVAAVRMLFALGRQAAGCIEDGLRQTPRCMRMGELENLVVALLQEDFVGALTAATRVVKTYGELPAALRNGLRLIGSVGAYAKVYNETKEEDPKAARDARKKALESLIDSATDRHDRPGKWIVSLGSNVALAYTRSWAHADPTMTTDPATGHKVTTPASDDLSKSIAWAPSVRIPLGIAIQRLPSDCYTGFHLGFQIGDLGQFVAVGDKGRVADVRWDSFVAPGLEVGVSFGAPHSAITFAVHAQYSPTLFPTSDGAASGAFRFGASIGYYVPFLDFN